MTWARFDDNFLDSPEAMRAGEDATNLHIRATIWCSKHLTDGAIPREALRAITQRRKVERLAARLVDVGVWEATPEGWVIPRFTVTNPSRIEVEARRSDLSEKRAAAGRIGGKHSAAVRSATSNPEATAQANREANGKQIASPPRSKREAPSRPVPSPEMETSSPRPPSPKATANPEPDTAKLFPDDPPADVPAKAPARREKAPEAPATPKLPFSIANALDALSAASGGKVPKIEGRDINKGHAVALVSAVKAYPSLDEWRTCGEWLAAGGERSRVSLGVSWAASGALRDAMAASRAWAEANRPALLDGKGFPVVTLLHAEAPDEWDLELENEKRLRAAGGCNG